MVNKKKVMDSLRNPLDAPDRASIHTAETVAFACEEFHCFVEMTEWMNYTYSDIITIRMYDEAVCLRDEDYHNYTLGVLLSARGPYYTFYCQIQFCPAINAWRNCKIADFPQAGVRIKDRLAAFLSTKNIYLLDDEDLLQSPATGCYTELDGWPATVFEVLFGELV